jgi:hypothetical protein
MRGVARDIVLLNAGAALYAAQVVDSVGEGIERGASGDRQRCRAGQAGGLRGRHAAGGPGCSDILRRIVAVKQEEGRFAAPRGGGAADVRRRRPMHRAGSHARC